MTNDGSGKASALHDYESAGAYNDEVQEFDSAGITVPWEYSCVMHARDTRVQRSTFNVQGEAFEACEVYAYPSFKSLPTTATCTRVPICDSHVSST